MHIMGTIFYILYEYIKLPTTLWSFRIVYTIEFCLKTESSCARLLFVYTITIWAFVENGSARFPVTDANRIFKLFYKSKCILKWLNSIVFPTRFIIERKKINMYDITLNITV